MKTQTTRRTLAALVIATALAASAFGKPAANILPEGTVTGDVGTPPRGWKAPHINYLDRIGGSIQLHKDAKEPGLFVSFTNTDNKTLVRIESQIEVDPEWIGRVLVFRARMRGKDFKPGTEQWHLAGVHVSYIRTDGKTAYNPGRLQITEANSEWRNFTSDWVIADDAKLINVAVGLMGVTGTLDVRDIEFSVQ